MNLNTKLKKLINKEKITKLIIGNELIIGFAAGFIFMSIITLARF